MTLSKMISFILERTKTKALREEVVKTVKQVQEATLKKWTTNDSPEAAQKLI